MIYLTTGGNGAGKTLFTLYDVRKQQLKENRPVYYHGFTAGEQLREWSWQEFNPKEWQDLPDGSICIFDECQNEFPAKIQGELPDYINAVAQHRRRRGFDFWMITPHPSLIHVNIRRLIESPSWHRHLKRTFGGDMVSELKFSHAETTCEKPGAGDKGQVTMRAFPKEVYGWYQSASLHTGKRKLPKQVWVFGGASAAALALAFFGYRQLQSNFSADEPVIATSQNPAQPETRKPALPDAPKRPLTLAEYLDQGTPRIPGMPHTAPRYDALTRPVHVPRPKSCIKFADNPCECTSQQGTKIIMSEATCMGIIKNGGVFADWDTNPGRARGSGYEYADYYQTGKRPDMTSNSIYDVVSMGATKNPKKTKQQDGSGYQSYAASVRSCVQPRVIYNLPPRQNRANPTVQYQVNLSDTGHVTQAQLLRSSGNPQFDEAVLKGVQGCSPFPRPTSGKYPPLIQVNYQMYEN